MNNECPGSDPNNHAWDSISSDMVKCRYCGYWTHWQNNRTHSRTAAAEQAVIDAKLAEEADRFWKEYAETHPTR